MDSTTSCSCSLIIILHSFPNWLLPYCGPADRSKVTLTLRASTHFNGVRISISATHTSRLTNFLGAFIVWPLMKAATTIQIWMPYNRGVVVALRNRRGFFYAIKTTGQQEEMT